MENHVVIICPSCCENKQTQNMANHKSQTNQSCKHTKKQTKVGLHKSVKQFTKLQHIQFHTNQHFVNQIPDTTILNFEIKLILNRNRSIHPIYQSRRLL